MKYRNYEDVSKKQMKSMQKQMTCDTQNSNTGYVYTAVVNWTFVQ